MKTTTIKKSKKIEDSKSFKIALFITYSGLISLLGLICFILFHFVGLQDIS